MSHTVTIQEIGFINHNVLRIRTQKPANYAFTPGQATEMAMDIEGWRDEKRPFTFTSLPQEGFLEFVIKVYPDHDGVTDKLQTLGQGDRLLVEDPWGAISFKGPGIFLAGGAGVTPFIAIFKHLASKGQLEGNQLFFGNKRARDIIMESEFEAWLGSDFINILSEEKSPKYAKGHIDKTFIEQHANSLENHFYLCGPPPMMDQIGNVLSKLGISKEKVVTEDFG